MVAAWCWGWLMRRASRVRACGWKIKDRICSSPPHTACTIYLICRSRTIRLFSPFSPISSRLFLRVTDEMRLLTVAVLAAVMLASVASAKTLWHQLNNYTFEVRPRHGEKCSVMMSCHELWKARVYTRLGRGCVCVCILVPAVSFRVVFACTRRMRQR